MTAPINYGACDTIGCDRPAVAWAYDAHFQETYVWCEEHREAEDMPLPGHEEEEDER